MDYLTQLQRLNACHGPSGDEGEVAAFLQECAKPYADACYIDTMGNLIVRKKGTGPKILFAAHMDSIGLIVTYIEESGYLRVGKIGGVHLGSILHSAVRFRNGTFGVVSLSEDVEEKNMRIHDLYLDIGAGSREEAEKRVQVGDTAVSSAAVLPVGERVAGPYMDNRISCLVLLEALSRISEAKNDLYFVFTTQEEVGLRGAKTASFGIEPDYGIAVDVTLGDALNSKHRGSSVLGGGAAIKVMDGSVISHPQMVERLVSLAQAQNISHQRDVISAGGTDVGAIHVSRSGVITGGISVPCRYIHSPVELVDLNDVEACVQLVVATAQAQFN